MSEIYRTRLMDTLAFEPVTFRSGNGAYLYDDKGKKYLDFFCDVGTASLGYGHPTTRFAMERMIREGIPLHAPNRYGFHERLLAAERLCKATGMDRVFFCNSGTEAVEAAIKCARLFHWNRALDNDRDPAHMRREIWSHAGGFHGRTYGGLSAGDGPAYHTEGFGVLLDGFHKFRSFDQIPPNAAAVILAPVFGNNDVRLIETRLLKWLRDYCSLNGIVLIFDEVQTGSGRSGGPGITYAQKIGVQPDLITLAKGVAMGAPVGALLANARLGGTFTPGRHFSTFGGNPLSSVMLNAMLDWLSSDEYSAVESMGAYLEDLLKAFPWAKNIRRVGMLLAFDYDGDTVALARAALAEGLLIGAFRNGPGPVKLTPPLNARALIIAEGVRLLERAHQAVGG